MVPGGPEFGVPIRITGRFSKVHSLLGGGVGAGGSVLSTVGGGGGGCVITTLGGCGSGRVKIMLVIPPPISTVGGGVGLPRLGCIPNWNGGRVGGGVMSTIGRRTTGRTVKNTGIVHSTCSRYDPLRVEYPSTRMM